MEVLKKIRGGYFKNYNINKVIRNVTSMISTIFTFWTPNTVTESNIKYIRKIDDNIIFNILGRREYSKLSDDYKERLSKTQSAGIMLVFSSIAILSLA